MKLPLLKLLVIAVLAVARASAEPAKPIDVYLIGGQSNATGQGYLANLPGDFKPDRGVLLYHSGNHLNSGEKPNAWLPLHQASESPDRFGPELGFGNRIQQRMPGRKIALIKHAFSGTNLYAQWHPGSDADDRSHWGPQFKTFVETVDGGLAALRRQGYEPTIRGMLWQQGESDAEKKVADAYGANLSHLIARVRQQFHCPEMLFVYGQVLPPPNTGVWRDKVRQAQKDVDQDSGSPLAVKGALVVKTDDLSQRANDRNTKYPDDHLHFGTAGTLELGRRMADRIADAMAAKK
jgi:hypothetical protein